MGERTNGYITIVAGMPEARIGTMPSGRRLAPDRKRELALQLRKHGHSYRRIADVLDVPYHSVLTWMDEPQSAGEIEILPPLSVPSAKPLAPSVDPVTPMALVLDDLCKRVEELAAVQRVQTDSMRTLEHKIVSIVQSETKSWGQKILKAINTVVGKRKDEVN